MKDDTSMYVCYLYSMFFVSLVPRNVQCISLFYKSLGLIFRLHSSLDDQEQVGSHYVDHVGRGGILSLLQGYTCGTSNSLVAKASST